MPYLSNFTSFCQPFGLEKGGIKANVFSLVTWSTPHASMLSDQHSDSAPVDNTPTRAFLLDRACSVMWCPPAGARNPADWFLSSITGVSHATRCETRIADVPQISCRMRQQSILLASGNFQDVIRPICVRTSPCRKNQNTGNFRLDAAALLVNSCTFLFICLN